MRGWLINVMMLAAVCVIGGTKLNAQNVQTVTPNDSCAVVRDSMFKAVADSMKIECIVNERYHKRVELYKRRWASLIPNKYMLQYAGGIGMVSAGIGWGYGRRQQWETHVMLGYLPKNHTPDAYWSLTLKETYTPWSIHLNHLFSVEPLFCGLFINSLLSGEFWTSEPDRYPKGYYGFSSRVRFHISLGQKFTIHIPAERRFLADRLTVYYEVSTCDLYVRQKVLNSSIPLKDILCLAVGAQFTIL